MATVEVQAYVQQAYDNFNGVLVGVATFVPNFFSYPSMAEFYPFAYGVQNPSATPYPLFPDDASAITYYSSIASAQVLNVINTNAGVTVYTATDIEPVSASVLAALMALSIDTIGDGSTYKKITAIEKTKLDSLAAVAVSGAYSDLTGKPSLPTVQAYDGTTQRLGAFPVFASATVSSGVAVFQLTVDGTSTGTALFPNSVIANSVNVTPNDATALYGFSWVFSNSNKTLTVTVNKSSATGVISLLGLNLLGSPISAANGTVVKLQVWGY